MLTIVSSHLLWSCVPCSTNPLHLTLSSLCYKAQSDFCSDDLQISSDANFIFQAGLGPYANVCSCINALRNSLCLPVQINWYLLTSHMSLHDTLHIDHQVRILSMHGAC